MQIHIQNLGPVKEAEIDLKPFTVFIGPNNTGKTWVAYTLGWIFQPVTSMTYVDVSGSDVIARSYEPLNSAFQQVLKQGYASLDFVEFANHYGEYHFNKIAQSMHDSTQKSVIGSQRGSFENMDIHVHLQESKRRFLKRIQACRFKAKYFVGHDKDSNSNQSFFYARSEDELLELSSKLLWSVEASKVSREENINFFSQGEVLEEPHRFTNIILKMLHGSLYTSVYIFSTNRTFVTLPFNLQSQNRLQPFTPLGEWNEFVIALVVWRSSKAIRDAQAEQDPSIQNYMRLAELLEGIAGGRVDFSTPEPDDEREILFQPAEGVWLELRAASSMVKQLALLILYLRYLARPNQLIIIDEPEMNLHPQAQVQITEFLAMLVNAGLHVLITTHSPYIVDHLENLMEAARVTRDASDAKRTAVREKLYLQRDEACIDPDNVSVYVFGDGTATKANYKEDEGAEPMIDTSTFGDVTRHLNKIYFDL